MGEEILHIEVMLLHGRDDPVLGVDNTHAHLFGRLEQ
jgi:hypothetical protein